jgi:hypothetical protein
VSEAVMDEEPWGPILNNLKISPDNQQVIGLARAEVAQGFDRIAALVQQVDDPDERADIAAFIIGQCVAEWSDDVMHMAEDLTVNRAMHRSTERVQLMDAWLRRCEAFTARVRKARNDAITYALQVDGVKPASVARRLRVSKTAVLKIRDATSWARDEGESLKALAGLAVFALLEVLDRSGVADVVPDDIWPW